MPSPNPTPRCAIVPDFDPRPWRGQTVATWNGNNVVIPAGADYFLDLVTFLNGRGCALTFQSALAAVKTGAGVWTAGIDADDRVYIECDSDDFTMSSGFQAFGFSASGHGLVGGSAPYRRTAPNEWTRAPVVDLYGTIDPASSLAFAVPGTTRRSGIQSPAIYLTAQGADPYDNAQGSPATANLSNVLATCGAGRTEVHVYLDEACHVVIAWSTNYNFDLTLVDLGFWAALGFDGTETRAAVGLTTQALRGNHRVPGACAFRDPPRRMPEGVTHQVNTTRMRSGEIITRRLSSWSKVSLEVVVYGAAADDGEDGDELAHVLRCLRAWYPGRRVNLYREVWDTRRGLSRLVQADVYDRFRTCELDGRHGRTPYYIATVPDAVEFASGLEYDATLTIGLEEAP